jgi:hypothetical protein
MGPLINFACLSSIFLVSVKYFSFGFIDYFPHFWEHKFCFGYLCNNVFLLIYKILQGKYKIDTFETSFLRNFQSIFLKLRQKVLEVMFGSTVVLSN